MSPRKKNRKLPKKGLIYITSSFRNTLVAICDQDANVKLWASSGSAGFKGAKKASPFASQLAIKIIAKKAREAGLKEANLILKGAEAGKEDCISVFSAYGIRLLSIKDKGHLPFNGCRFPKVRKT